MPGPKLLRLFFAAAVVAASAWFLHRAEQGRWQEQAVAPGTDILGEFPVNEVASVILTGPDGRVTLQRGETGWGVAERSGYPADFERLSALILRLSGLDALQSVPAGEADHGALALRTAAEGVPRGEAGTLVELRDAAGGSLAALIIGKTHLITPPGMRPETAGTPGGRYVMPADGGGRVFLVAETFSDLPTSPAAWIGKAFVRPGGARQIGVKASGRDRAWTVRRDAPSAAWRLAGVRKGRPNDAPQLAGIDSLLAGMAVADVPDAPDDPRLKPLADNPVTVTVETFDDVRYTFTIGEGSGDLLPVMVAAGAIDPEDAPSAPEQRREMLRAELEAAAKFRDRAVFIPRSFLELFFATRGSLSGAGPAP